MNLFGRIVLVVPNADINLIGQDSQNNFLYPKGAKMTGVSTGTEYSLLHEILHTVSET